MSSPHSTKLLKAYWLGIGLLIRDGIKGGAAAIAYLDAPCDDERDELSAGLLLPLAGGRGHEHDKVCQQKKEGGNYIVIFGLCMHIYHNTIL